MIIHKENEKRHLSKFVRVFWAWKGMSLIILSILFFLYFFQKDEIQFYIIGTAIISLILYLIYIELKYRNYFYILTKKEIIIRSGILNTKRIVIPYIKIQNINVSRSIAQRILGSATIKIETSAGKADESEAIIPEVFNYKKLHAELLEKRETAKGKD